MDWRTRARNRMKELGLTQQEMAHLLGLTQGAVSQFLLDRNEPSLGTFVRFCQILDVSADWLLFGKAAARPPITVSKAAQRIATAWERLPKKRQRDIEGALRVFSKNGAL